MSEGDILQEVLRMKRSHRHEGYLKEELFQGSFAVIKGSKQLICFTLCITRRKCDVSVLTPISVFFLIAHKRNRYIFTQIHTERWGNYVCIRIYIK